MATPPVGTNNPPITVYEAEILRVEVGHVLLSWPVGAPPATTPASRPSSAWFGRSTAATSAASGVSASTRTMARPILPAAPGTTTRTRSSVARAVIATPARAR